MYSPIDKSEWEKNFSNLDKHSKDHIDNVLEAYMHLTGTQLEQLTNQILHG